MRNPLLTTCVTVGSLVLLAAIVGCQHTLPSQALEAQPACTDDNRIDDNRIDDTCTDETCTDETCTDAAGAHRSQGDPRAKQCRQCGNVNGQGRLARLLYGERGCDFCHGDIPVKPGTYLNQIHQAEIAVARRDRFTISEHEWYQGQEQLGPEGRRHLREVAHLMLESDFPLILEADTVAIDYQESLEEALARSDELNARRKDLLVSELIAQGVPDAENRVILEPVDRVGIRGIEAPGVFSRSIGGGFGGQQGGGGFGGGGFGGGGLGGGGGGFGGGGVGGGGAGFF